jgi:hypothetical protein
MKILSISAALISSLLITTAAPSPSFAAQSCEEKACIELYIQDGRIVIEGRRGKGPTSTSITTPAPSKSAKPKVSKKPSTPRPTTSPRVRTTRKPSVKKVIKPKVMKSEAPGFSLVDKLVETIPTSGIAYQPSFSPLIKTPVFFWCDVPTAFTKKVEILGEIVDIRLRPAFIWHYGDGVIFATRDVGAGYPDGKIQHSYSKPGHYLIELVTSWQGEYTIGGVSRPIPSELVTVAILPITVVAAPTRFLN